MPTKRGEKFAVRLQQVQRGPGGKLLPGSVLNPQGSTFTGGMHGVDAKCSLLARRMLEEAETEGGLTLFERVARGLLAPIIERYDQGFNQGKEYLVNHASILGTLEFLTKRGYGKDFGSPSDEQRAKAGGIVVLINVPRPAPRAVKAAAIEVKRIAERS